MLDMIKYTVGFGMIKGHGYQQIAAAVRFNIVWYAIEVLGFPLLLVWCNYMGWKESMWWIFSVYAYTLIFLGILKHVLNVMAVNVCGLEASNASFISYRFVWGLAILALWGLFMFQLGTMQYWNVWFALFVPAIAMLLIFLVCALISKILWVNVSSGSSSRQNAEFVAVMVVGLVVLIYKCIA